MNTVKSQRAAKPEFDIPDLARRVYVTYLSRDRKAMSELLHDRFTFTSPRDDHIDKAQYFRRCWEGGDNFRAFHIDKVLVQDHEAFVLYEAELKGGERFRNAEFLKFENGQLREIEVFFGPSPHA